MKYRSETSDGVLSVERDDELETARDELETERCSPAARPPPSKAIRPRPATVNITATRNRPRRVPREQSESPVPRPPRVPVSRVPHLPYNL